MCPFRIIRFAPAASEKFFNTEGASPELLALSESLSSPNALNSSQYRKDDRKWKFVSEAARSPRNLWGVFGCDNRPNYARGQAGCHDRGSRCDSLTSTQYLGIEL